MDKTTCFVRQYEVEIFPGVSVDGARTLSENIADNGGLITAYQAYQSWVARRPADARARLPGLGFTNEQLIFLGFARAHCSNRKRRATELYLQMDRHSPSRVRVNTAMSNLPEFAEAFKCAPKAKLVLDDEERCTLW